MTSVEATIKFCKEFLQQLNKYPVEYLEGYVEKTKKPARPKAVPVGKPASASTAGAARKSVPFKVIVKKLGGVAKAHEIQFSDSNAGLTVDSLKKEVGKIFGCDVDGFSLMYKGRPLSDGGASLPQSITDPSTPVYVNVKAAGSGDKKGSKSQEALPADFFTELRGLLGKHVSGESAEKLASRFKQEYPNWQ